MGAGEDCVVSESTNKQAFACFTAAVAWQNGNQQGLMAPTYMQVSNSSHSTAPLSHALWWVADPPTRLGAAAE